MYLICKVNLQTTCSWISKLHVECYFDPRMLPIHVHIPSTVHLKYLPSEALGYVSNREDVINSSTHVEE